MNAEDSRKHIGASFHLSRITQTEAATWHENIANRDDLQHS
jgi:hypothetical protein